MIRLPIEKKYLDMIRSGEKSEDYREIDYYHTVKFAKEMYYYHPKKNISEMYEDIYYGAKYFENKLFSIKFESKSDSIVCLVQLKVATGREEWGAVPDKNYYVLEILRTRDFNNC